LLLGVALSLSASRAASASRDLARAQRRISSGAGRKDEAEIAALTLEQSRQFLRSAESENFYFIKSIAYKMARFVLRY
jgi:hypothetical protein